MKNRKKRVLWFGKRAVLMLKMEGTLNWYIGKIFIAGPLNERISLELNNI
jgi:hypothetical protein